MLEYRSTAPGRAVFPSVVVFDRVQPRLESLIGRRAEIGLVPVEKGERQFHERSRYRTRQVRLADPHPLQRFEAPEFRRKGSGQRVSG